MWWMFKISLSAALFALIGVGGVSANDSLAPDIPDTHERDCERRGGTYSYPYCNLPGDDASATAPSVEVGEHPIFLINKCPMPLEIWLRRYTVSEGWVSGGPWKLAKDDFKSGRGPDQGAAMLNGTINDDPNDRRSIAFHEAGQPIHLAVFGGIKNKNAKWTELASDEWEIARIEGTAADGREFSWPAISVPVGRPFTHLRTDYRPRVGALINSLNGIGISLRCDPPGQLP